MARTREGGCLCVCRNILNDIMAKHVTMWSFIIACSFLVSCAVAQSSATDCYDYNGRAKRCKPPFVNAAFNMTVEATNTCGIRAPDEYCVQTRIPGQRKSCETCDDRDPYARHPPAFLTDFKRVDRKTWWQSETMLENTQYPTQVNLTLHLGKTFDITYIRLIFHTSRPESFAIYKRTKETGQWIPYQFYSASCQRTYRRPNSKLITRENEGSAICTDESSDISPLTGGIVAFSTLEGRPSGYDFENSQVLQEWVMATDIRIVLTRMNTFGDEVFGDPNVLKSYYYAISDFAVGGICKCNGHASECVKSTGQGLEERLVCQCQHNTTGPDCGECHPFYNDQPWHRATATDAHECKPCNCNGLSNRCYFDEELWRRTGHGGHCMDCRGNTAGANCERCEEDYYKRTPTDRCEACGCNPVGSRSTQCDNDGRCVCKPGVIGEKCDRCEVNHFDFGPSGCRECACVAAGSRDNRPVCDPSTGNCACKENVEGQNCDRCKPGYFGLNADNEFGCIACFCYGHSSVCSVAPGYSLSVIQSDFSSGRQGWSGLDRSGVPFELDFNGITQVVGVSAPQNEDTVYFSAPSRYLGDQRFSYNRDFTFTLRVGEEGARASRMDIVIESGEKRISAPIFVQENQIPRTLNQEFSFRLHDHSSYKWTPNGLSSMDFISILSNITSMKIRGTYTPGGVGFIDDVKLESARQGNGGREVFNVEQCQCPEGYVGQFCESCQPGYYRDPVNGGPFARCVPCNCHGHSDVCDANTGTCICQHNTIGQNCERCAPGYYGYPLAGTPDDCKACPCPNNGECVELLNKEVACLNCREGYTGNRCDICADGYFGDPNGKQGARRPCTKCQCNENIDPNAVANCDSVTGECLKCIYNTDGFSCDRCLPGFYGDALSLPKGGCKPCNCYPGGTVPSGNPDEPLSCDAQTGQCQCLPNVRGRNCDQCIDGYWNIDSGVGCERCSCSSVGAYNRTCDIKTGQCYCKPGVNNRRCNQCQPLHYGFSSDGCDACNCDPLGSTNLQCDELTGRCECHDNIEGRMCDRCMENKYNISAGCIDCPVCYNLVQDRVNIHRRKLNELRILIQDIKDNPRTINDTDFKQKIMMVNESVNILLEDARRAIGGDGPLAEQLKALRLAIADITTKCERITEDVALGQYSSSNSQIDLDVAVEAIDRADQALREAENYIENEGRDALQKAIEEQEKGGLQNSRLTEIAQEARELADEQEEEATKIEQCAKNALNTSREAWRIAEEALRKPSDTATDLEEIRIDIQGAKNLYEQTSDLAEQAEKQAEEAYEQSIKIFTDAGNTDLIPNVDVDALKENAANIKEEAEVIITEAQDLMSENSALILDVDRQTTEAEDLLLRGINRQQEADQLLAEADKARGIAIEAVTKAEAILKDANSTLETLKGFDELVRKNKAEAEEALKKKDDILNMIREAEDKTAQARLNLEDAVYNANLAKTIAMQAQDVAEMASEEAGNIRADADKTKTRASMLLQESQELSVQIQQAEQRLIELENQAEEDGRLAQEALQKAGEAKETAEESSKNVKTALDIVNDILDKLATLGDVDLQKLDQLEQRLDETEQRLREAKIEENYKLLQESRNQQLIWITDYTSELLQLRVDVQNVHVINATIPRRCFKQAELEPTDKPIIL